MKEWNELRSRARYTRAQYRECGWHTWAKLYPNRELAACGAIPGRDGLMCRCGEPVRIETVSASMTLRAGHVRSMRIRCACCRTVMTCEYNDYEQRLFASMPGGIMEDMRRKWRAEVRG